MTNFDLFAVFMAVVGAVLVGIGFWNAQKLRELDQPETRRNITAAE